MFYNGSHDGRKLNVNSFFGCDLLYKVFICLLYFTVSHLCLLNLQFYLFLRLLPDNHVCLSTHVQIWRDVGEGEVKVDAERQWEAVSWNLSVNSRSAGGHGANGVKKWVVVVNCILFVFLDFLSHAIEVQGHVVSSCDRCQQ